MPTIQCSRCGEEREALQEVPIPGEIGERIRHSICKDCHQAWKVESTRFIQDNALRLTEAADRAKLLGRLKAFMGFEGQPTPSSVAGPAPTPHSEPSGPRLPETGPRPYWPF